MRLVSKRLVAKRPVAMRPVAMRPVEARLVAKWPLARRLVAMPSAPMRPVAARLGALALSALVAACAPVGGAGPSTPATASSGAGFDAAPAGVPAPVPTATGVDIPGTGREIGFGRHLPGAEAALTRLYGAPARRACGGGTVLTVRSLELHFEGETFAGWRRGGDSRGRLCDVAAA